MDRIVFDPTKPRRLADTRIFLASKDVNLADKDTIEWLKANKITHVFCTFPLKQKHFDGLPEDAKRGAPTITEYFKALNIDPVFAARLRGHDIGTSSLLRSPKYLREFRGFESFLKEAKNVKKNFLIQCLSGWHASGAYAMYYLASATPLDIMQIREKFTKSGYRGSDLSLMESFFKRARFDIKEVVEKKLEKMRIAAQIKTRAEEKRYKKMHQRWPGRKRK